MVITIKIILSVLFGYAGIVKILDPEGMRQAIEAYQVIEGPLVVWAAYFIPALEVVVAVGLWWRRLAAESCFIILGLSVFFTVILLSAWLRGLNIDCGCFGKAIKMDNYIQLIIRDLALVILSGYLWWRITFGSPKKC